MDSGLKIRGDIEITTTDRATGLIVKTVHRNRVLDAGLAWIINNCVNGKQTDIVNMAIGSGANPVQPGDSGLNNELARISGIPQASGGSIVLSVTFPENSGTGTISELGIFLGSGAMFARSVIPAQNKSSTTSMQVQWTITLQAS
jgi:hypothetical protein